MKRSVRCIAQTINLSNPKTCLRPKQGRRVVSPKTMDPCSKSNSCYVGPKAVPIRVCSRKDIERATCEQKVCECPDATPPLTKGQKLCKALVFALKSAIMAGLIYWSYVEGVWGDAAETEDLYYRIMGVIAPTLPNAEEDNTVYLPPLRSLKYRLIQTYNHAVFNIMNAFVSVPGRVRNRMEYILFPPDDIEEETEAAESEE